MRAIEREVLDGISKMADQAPDLGLCPTPFRIIHAQFMEAVLERDKLRKELAQKRK